MHARSLDPFSQEELYPLVAPILDPNILLGDAYGKVCDELSVPFQKYKFNFAQGLMTMNILATVNNTGATCSSVVRLFDDEKFLKQY